MMAEAGGSPRGAGMLRPLRAGAKVGRGFEWGLGPGAAGSFLALVPGGLEGQRGKWVGGGSRGWRGARGQREDRAPRNWRRRPGKKTDHANLNTTTVFRELLLLLLSRFSRDPIDGSPPGSTVPGILQARTLEWVAISLSNA